MLLIASLTYAQVTLVITVCLQNCLQENSTYLSVFFFKYEKGSVVNLPKFPPWQTVRKEAIPYTHAALAAGTHLQSVQNLGPGHYKSGASIATLQDPHQRRPEDKWPAGCCRTRMVVTLFLLLSLSLHPPLLPVPHIYC